MRLSRIGNGFLPQHLQNIGPVESTRRGGKMKTAHKLTCRSPMMAKRKLAGRYNSSTIIRS
jgi:hypothetical protein